MNTSGSVIRPFPVVAFWGVGLLFMSLLVGGAWVTHVLLLAFAGLIFATLLLSLCDLVALVLPVPRGWRLLISVLLLLVIVGGLFWILVPRITEQVGQLQSDLPKSITALKKNLQTYSWGGWVISRLENPIEFVGGRQGMFSRMTGVVSGTLGAIAAVVVIAFAGLYFAAQPRLYVEGLLRLVPPSRRARGRDVCDRMAGELRAWLIGQLIAITFIGAMTWLGLWMLGIQLALTLAVVAAILAFIPNFGPILAAIPAILIAFLDGPGTAGWVAALYVGIQTVESYVVTPIIQQQAVSLPPALTLFSQLIMGALVGGAGLALATPLLVVTMVAVRCLYVEDRLERPQQRTQGETDGRGQGSFEPGS